MDENFSFQTELNKLEREVLIALPNPKYNEMIETYDHLKVIKMNERDTKPEVPIHVILGASDYVKIKMQKCPSVGKVNEPIAEQTKIGWVIMSPGRGSDLVSSLYTRTSVSDFDRLCDINVLGVEENHLSHVYKNFKQQLERHEGGWHETGLVWNENKVPLNNKKFGSLGRLKSLLKWLEQNSEIFKAYDQVIRDQLVNNVIERVLENQSENPSEFFLPHRPVFRQNAESTKLGVVYDALAKSESGYFLNDCLEKGENELWDILIRTRFRPMVLNTDIEKAFLQICIKEKKRGSP